MDVIAAGRAHSCALLPNASVRCWGANEYGQLGNASYMDSADPVTVTGLSGVVSIVAGRDHNCALLSDKTMTCWGNNSHGELGDGGVVADSNVPLPVAGLSNIVGLAAGALQTTCALAADGTVFCWGTNNVGQFGNGTYRSSSVPAANHVTNAVDIALSGLHGCAALSDGTVECWGMNTYGQLGDGTNTFTAEPVVVVGLSGAVAVAVGYAHSCALRNDGTLRCWGYNNHGQLGHGDFDDHPTLVEVGGLFDVVTVAAGGDNTCGVRANGSLACWGINNVGQLGVGSTPYNSPTPMPVTLSGVMAVAIGPLPSQQQVCAMTTAASVWCWGYNDRGQLGVASPAYSFLPLEVTGL